MKKKDPALICTAHIAFILSLGFTALSCSPSAERSSQQLIVKELPGSQVLLQFEGGQIQASEVNSLVNAELSDLDQRAVDIYQEAAERILLDKLLEAEAVSQKSTVEEIMAAVGLNSAVSDEELKAFMRDNNLKDGVRDPRSGRVQQVSEAEVRSYLESQKKRSSQEIFLRDLLTQASPRMLLEKREVIPVPEGLPVLGPDSAPVKMHKFSDFDCVHCARAFEVVKELNKEFPQELQIHYRFFVQSEDSLLAAVSAQCAHRQGAFWPMASALFASPSKRSLEGLTEIGTELVQELGADSFSKSALVECIEAEPDLNFLSTESQAAEALRVTQTPTFFINGKRVVGALGQNDFRALIQEELRSKAK